MTIMINPACSSKSGYLFVGHVDLCKIWGNTGRENSARIIFYLFIYFFICAEYFNHNFKLKTIACLFEIVASQVKAIRILITSILKIGFSMRLIAVICN